VDATSVGFKDTSMTSTHRFLAGSLLAFVTCAPAAMAQQPFPNDAGGLAQRQKAALQNRARIRASKIRTDIVTRHTPGNEAGIELSRTTYDANGNVTEIRTIAEKTQLPQLANYRYDAQARLVESTSPVSGTRTTYVYDAGGRLAASQSKHVSGEFALGMSYRYDDAGKLTETSILDQAGVERTRTTLAYDSKGRLTELRARWIKGPSTEDEAKESVLKMAYDASGFLSDQTQLDTTGAVLTRTHFENDAAGRPLSIATYNGADKLLSITHRRYDAQGNLLEERITQPAAGIISKTTNRYDPQGNLLGTIRFNKDGKAVETTRHTYERFQ
jgi:YD repeat-containing protein